jgi:hypothetical protein
MQAHRDLLFGCFDFTPLPDFGKAEWAALDPCVSHGQTQFHEYE